MLSGFPDMCCEFQYCSNGSSSLKKTLHFYVCSIHEGQKIPTKLVDVLSALRATEAYWVGEAIYWKTGKEETHGDMLL